MKNFITTHWKNLLNAAAIGTAIGTIFSVFYAAIITGPLAFQLVNPFTLFTSTHPQNNFHALYSYALTGIFIYTTVWLFSTANFGMKRENIIHFLMSFGLYFLLSLLSISSVLSWNSPVTHFGMTFNRLIAGISISALEALITYFLVWGILWLYYHFQIKKINKKIKSRY